LEYNVQSTLYYDLVVPAERTGGGDPERTVELLWAGTTTPRTTRGPRPRLDLRTVTAAAVELADEDGIAAVTMRALAARLGLASPTALYTYVPSKAELVDLMVDACFAGFALDAGGGVAERIRAIADANRALYRRHAWLADVALERPPLGPGQLRKYELELSALVGLGLPDHQTDLVLGLVIAVVRAYAASAASAGSASEEAAWWAAAGPALARHANPADYPLSARIGTASGEAQGRAQDPERAYGFALERITAGVEDLLRR
jgi:AcrR family transcriptional regulator